MGQNLSIMSVFGMLALSGVVVNDSLVLVDYINRKRREGTPCSMRCERQVWPASEPSCSPPLPLLPG